MKKSAKQALALLLTLMLSLALLSGCNSNTGSSPSEPSPDPISTPAPTPEEAPDADTEDVLDISEPAAGPFTVTDMMGVEVTFDAVPQTVATFGSIGVLNTLIECLGCGDRLCNNMGANFESTKSYPHLRLEFAPQTKDAPLLTNTDGELAMEEILLLAPDVCVTMSQAIADQLRAQDLKVIYLEWQVDTDIPVAMRLMGEVLGQQELAEDYLTYFDNMVAEAESLTADIPEDERKTVLYGSVTSFSQPHIIAEWWITEAGGISVTNNGRPDTEGYSYTMEDVLLWDPDVMLVSGRSQIEELEENTTFADLTSVKNGDIYCVPTVGHAWGNRTVEQPLTIFWTMNKLYPEIMSDEELGEKIYYFYDHFFKYQLSDEQLAVYVEGK